MPKRIPEGEQRTPFQVYVTYGQRNTMRRLLDKKKVPYGTYGELVMGAIRGEMRAIKADANPKATVGVYLHISQADQDEIRSIAHRDNVSVQAVVRNRVFGEPYPVKKQPQDMLRVTMLFTKEQAELVTFALDTIGATGSTPQGAKLLILRASADIVLANQESKKNTDLTDKVLEK